MIRSERTLLGMAALLYFSFLVYLTVGLRFNMLTSDVLGYWHDSLNWRAPFSTWWVPGYPLLIAAVRGITFNLVPPLGIMVGISAVAYLAAVSAVYRLALHNQFPYPFFLALVFALFPLEGLAGAVYPRADITAIALLLLAVLNLEKRRWTRFVIFCGAAMIVQKVMWFFVPPLLCVAFVRSKESRLLLPCAFLPLAVWWVCGAIYHHDILWCMRWSCSHLLVSKSALPIMDGLITPLLSNSLAKTWKGIAIAAVTLLIIISAYYNFRHRHWVGVCIALSLFGMVALVNSYEIWVVVRYSPVLVIPLSFVEIRFVKPSSQRYIRLVAWVMLVAFLASNLAFGFYQARLGVA
jgi:hypothetical protein